MKALPIAICLATLPIAAAALHADDSVPRTRSVRFTYSAEIREIPVGTQEVKLWLPFPPTNDYQRISNIVVRSDVATSVHREEEYGNRALFLSVREPAGKPVRVELQFDVHRRERRDPQLAGGEAVRRDRSPAEIDRRSLAPDRLVPIDGKIFELAREVTAGHTDRFDQARAIYEFTVATLKYDKSGTGWGRGDIVYACDAKRGNCTDFHALFIGLCRARGIPARFEIGFSLPSDRPSGEIAGYHCWADCHIKDRGWVPVDCSEAQKHPDQREYFFGAHDEHRIAFSSGRDIRLNPAQAGERLNFFVYPYAEVDGRPHEKIDRKIRYENLDKD